jgi:glycosyltransferase involved in cell wall biosynthesis
MKVLQISNKSPWPATEGGSIASYALISGLEHAGHEVHILTMSTWKHPVLIDQIPEDLRLRTQYDWVEVDTRIKVWPAFLNLFTKSSYNIERFISKEFGQALEAKLKQNTYDFILLESLYLTPYLNVIRKNSDAVVILRAHNIEHRIWERLAVSEKNILKKIYLNLLTKRLKRYETQVLPEVDGIAAITDADAAFFRVHSGAALVRVVPFGVMPDSYIYTPQNERSISMCHLGSMNWMPNQEGIKWFLLKCWPGIHTVFPHLKLYLAGRNMPPWFSRNTWPNVEIVGEVDDSQNFISNHPVKVVPLLSGSGVRVKIIEAMALGRTVITTTTGAEGIRYTPGHNILIADTPIAFYEQIKFCVNDPAACAEIGRNARVLIEECHNNIIATNAVVALAQEVIEHQANC